MPESRLARSLRRRKAIEAAAIERHGWLNTDHGKLNPQRHWERSTESQRRACIELTTPIIEAYERVMEGSDDGD